MSRIGKLPINLPSGVSVTVNGETVTVKGPKGELRQQINPEIQVSVEDGVVTFTRPSDEKQHRSMHGLYRALVNNMVVGVSQGFVKKLELVGVGYRAASNGQVIELSLGYSHPIHLMVPPEIKVEAVTDRKSNPIITLESVDKQLLGMVCAKLRSLRKPEPYKGKGVRFQGEVIRRKAGKSSKV
jgi:large subunit ribosomal protein L6